MSRQLITIKTNGGGRSKLCITAKSNGVSSAIALAASAANACEKESAGVPVENLTVSELASRIVLEP